MKDIVQNAEEYLRGYVRGDYCDHHEECEDFIREQRWNGQKPVPLASPPME